MQSLHYKRKIQKPHKRKQNFKKSAKDAPKICSKTFF